MPVQKVDGSQFSPSVYLSGIDGSDAVPIACFTFTKVYTMSNRPAAAAGNLNLVIWVVDAPPGDRVQYSDGSSWIPIRS